MKRKQPYKAPAILREVRLQLEGEILAASTVDKTAPIISNGQELVEINAEDYVIESVKYGYGKHYNKDNMAIQNDSGTTYNLGFYNYLTTNQRSIRNNICYPINPEKNINYIDIYLKDNNLNIYSVQNATLIDYKEFFKAATININGQTYDAFN